MTGHRKRGPPREYIYENAMETKTENKAKQTSQPWDPHILSYG